MLGSMFNPCCSFAIWYFNPFSENSSGFNFTFLPNQEENRTEGQNETETQNGIEKESVVQWKTELIRWCLKNETKRYSFRIAE